MKGYSKLASTSIYLKTQVLGKCAYFCDVCAKDQACDPDSS